MGDVTGETARTSRKSHWEGGIVVRREARTVVRFELRPVEVI